MAVSMGDVAAHAGVSQRTVSNVVNGYKHVSPAMRERVTASLRELGYRPNAAARQLRGGRTNTVTLAIPDFRERFFADLAEAVIDRAAEIGQRVLIEPTYGENARELALLQSGGAQLTDGLIMVTRTLEPEDDALQASGMPVVLIGDRETRGGVHHLDLPNRAGARAATEHLLAAGRRRIALLGAESSPVHAYRMRHAGYVEALRSAGIDIDPALLWPAGWSRAEGEEAVTSRLARGERMPEAVFAMNDSLALGVLRALQRHGLRVPEDVAVIGFDDIFESQYASPSLSSIAPDLPQLAELALDLLGEQFEARGTERERAHRRIAFELRARESSASASPTI